MFYRFRRSWLSPFLALLGASAATAQTSWTHAGNTDPATEGWRPYDVVAGVNFDYTQRPGIGPVNDNGTRAWKVEDFSTDASTNSIYEERAAATTGLFSGAYWRYSAYVKALVAGPNPTTDNSASNCAFSIFSHTFNVGSVAGGTGYGVTLYDNNAGGTAFHMAGNSNGNPGSLDLTLATGFNWVELIHNPNTGFTSLYINGLLRNSNVPYTGSSGGNYGGNIVDWGDLIQTNGGYGGGEWGQVDFTYSPTPLSPLGVPEPSTVALALTGGLILGVLALRRRRFTSLPT